MFFARYFAALRAVKFNDVDVRLQRQTFEWFEKFVNMFTACDTWYEYSCRNSENYIACPGNNRLNWKDKGYRTVFDLLQVSSISGFSRFSFVQATIQNYSQWIPNFSPFLE